MNPRDPAARELGGGRFACNIGGLRHPNATRKEIDVRGLSDACEWLPGIGLGGADIAVALAETREECCGTCRAIDGCTGVSLDGGRCHLKTGQLKMQPQRGTMTCVPLD